MGVKNYKETKVYKLSFEQAMDVFETSKLFPREEIYSLTDQVRLSSRSVCANLTEAYLWLANTLHTKNMHKWFYEMKR